MRLVGLPNVTRYPEAIVDRDAERISIRFGGRDVEQTMSVPLRYLSSEDEEFAELWLMAQLQEIGYQVRRGE